MDNVLKIISLNNEEKNLGDTNERLERLSISIDERINILKKSHKQLEEKISQLSKIMDDLDKRMDEYIDIIEGFGKPEESELIK